MKTLLWLDDVRNPSENGWLNFSPIGKDVKVIWIKSYDEFVYFINEEPLPDAICFDHDLGERDYTVWMDYAGMSKEEALEYISDGEKTGYDCAKYLIDMCIVTGSKLPLYNIQSANPVGKENIKYLLENYKKHYE